MTGSYSRLGTSDQESRTTGVIHAYDTSINVPKRQPDRVLSRPL